jgi:hypothetical protein
VQLWKKRNAAQRVRREYRTAAEVGHASGLDSAALTASGSPCGFGAAAAAAAVALSLPAHPPSEVQSTVTSEGGADVGI